MKDQNHVPIGSVSQPHIRRFNGKFHHLRWVAIFLGALNVTYTYIQRLSMSTVMLRMVNQTKLYLDQFPDGDPSDIDNGEEQGEFDWNYTTQSIIINMYLIGYAIPQIFVARMSEVYGRSKSMILTKSVVVICNLLSPLAAYYGWAWLALTRLLIGIASSPSYPISIGMFESWLYDSEHSRGLAIVQLTANLGVVFAPLAAGYLSQFHYSVFFYSVGLVGFIYILLWWLIAGDTPEESWLMSSSEIDQLMAKRRYNNKASDSNELSDENHSKNPTVVPWRKILTSSNFYLNEIGWITSCAAAILYSIALPIYMRTIFNVDVVTNGQIGFIVQLTTIPGIIWAGSLGSWLTDVKKWPAKRKFILLYGIATLVPMVMWCTPWFTSNLNLIVFGFSLIRLFSPAIEFATIGTVLEDWSSQGLTTTLMGICNSVSNTLSIFFIWWFGIILDNLGGNTLVWNFLFLAMGLLNVVGFLAYLLNIALQRRHIRLATSSGLKR